MTWRVGWISGKCRWNEIGETGEPRENLQKSRHCPPWLISCSLPLFSAASRSADWRLLSLLMRLILCLILTIKWFWLVYRRPCTELVSSCMISISRSLHCGIQQLLCRSVRLRVEKNKVSIKLCQFESVTWRPTSSWTILQTYLPSLTRWPVLYAVVVRICIHHSTPNATRPFIHQVLHMRSKLQAVVLLTESQSWLPFLDDQSMSEVLCESIPWW